MARRDRGGRPAAGNVPDHPEHSWNVREAKAQLSKVVNGALERPQRIARRDGASVVVISEEDYRSLLHRAESQVDMVDYFRSHAIGGNGLERPPPRPARAARRLP